MSTEGSAGAGAGPLPGGQTTGLGGGHRPRLDPGLELVEQVDDDGQVLRTVTRAEMRAGNLGHRMVAVVVNRPDGRVVVHQRAAWKDIHPSRWDVAFGGVPDVGESDQDAAMRELAEEAGLEVTAEQLVDLGPLRSSDGHTRWRGHFYLLTTDRDLAPADGEVAALAEIKVVDLEAWAATTPLCDDTEAVVLPMLIAALSH